MEFRFLLLFFITSVYGELCPKQCDCDMEKGRNRAECVDQNIISVDIGVPKEVQVYSLRRNAISELDNFCFKNAGYSSIEVLNLSYNLIFWIGLHAFAGIDKLLHLDLSNNRLRQIPPDLFWDTPKLDFLDLSSNVFEELKNEPFLMHDKLQILNLNNCRIKSLPERLFKRLPNLRKLDISDNYMVTMKVDVLIPLRKLERIELKSEYWQCTPDLMETKKWIQLKGIAYQNICSKKRLPNMFEKIISIVTTERPAVDVNNVWNISTTHNETLPVVVPTTEMSAIGKFDKEFSAFEALIIGLEIGLGVGVVGTYVWLRRVCCCTKIVLRRRRGRRSESDLLASLISHSSIDPDSGTPPPSRRSLPPPPSRPSQPPRPSRPSQPPPLSRPSQPPPYGMPESAQIDLPEDAIVDASRPPNLVVEETSSPYRPPTPPPRYSTITTD